MALSVLGISFSQRTLGTYFERSHGKGVRPMVFFHLRYRILRAIAKTCLIEKPHALNYNTPAQQTFVSDAEKA